MAQPMDRPPFELSTHDGNLNRLATSTTQAAQLTARIAGLPATILFASRA